ncbi:MAG: ribose 5-phosphate isomerase B, partial [Candidatus Diapherotrites archaeon]|nr:ribose 5-phosphate isomerase B [Candidatus Diapherotrites archaeon]
MKVFLGSDHAGFKLKEEIKKHLQKKGFDAQDLGAHSEESTDYPDYAAKVAKNVAKDRDALGIVVCGTGTGTAIAANKVKGVRAAQATSTYLAKMAREHNDANVLSLGSRVTKTKDALGMVDVFLSTPFSGEERHRRRVE